MFSGKRIFFASFAVILAALAGTGSASAAITLRQVQALEGDRVEVIFDGKINKSQIRTEVMGDTVQLTVEDADVYPAKISNLSGHTVRKVFAYQYAPRVIRVRLTLRDSTKRSAEDIVQLSTSGKTLSVVVNGANASTDSVRSTSAAIVEANPASGTEAKNENEARLAARVTEAAKPVARKASNVTEEKTPIAGGKNVGNPLAAFGKLMAVLVLFLAVALAARKLLARRSGLANRLGKWSGLKAKGPIEVIATHYLGPKKSIAVVRVGGRELVLGITDEAINLITQMHQSVEEEADAQNETRTAIQGTEGFESALKDAATAPKAAGPQKSSSVRSQIRSRLEGMKPL